VFPFRRAAQSCSALVISSLWTPVTEADDRLTFAHDPSTPPTLAGLITPGSTWNFQDW
jgi:hypothetical protein